MNRERAINRQRHRRKLRVRKSLRGTAERPRLSVFRSYKHIYAQLIDDVLGQTLLAASTREPTLRNQVSYGGNRKAAGALGTVLAQRALEAGIRQVSFDRGAFQYHGRLAALADSAREAGLQF